MPPYLFVEISRKIAEKKAQGIEVISFGIGDPDIPTPPNVVERLRETALDAPNHRYPESDGLPEFRQATANWYQRRFGISLDSDKEVLSLIGAKEGIGHAALCFLDPGDVALVPDPGYPVYSVGTWFAGGECHWMPLLEENGWLPDLDAIPEDVARRAKLMWLNYPNNPTGAIAESDYFEKVVEFAARYDIAVLHDASYTEVAFDGYKPASFLQTPGAMDVGMEFHSLSKSYNMTGWRLGVAAGNAEMIDALMVVKSNLDSGVPQAIQYMGIEALEGPLGRHRRAQRHLPAAQGPRDGDAARHRAARGPAQGRAVRVGAHPRRLHLRADNRIAARTVRHRGHAGQRLRRIRRGLHTPYADHRRRRHGTGPPAPCGLEAASVPKGARPYPSEPSTRGGGANARCW